MDLKNFAKYYNQTNRELSVYLADGKTKVTCITAIPEDFYRFAQICEKENKGKKVNTKTLKISKGSLVEYYMPTEYYGFYIFAHKYATDDKFTGWFIMLSDLEYDNIKHYATIGRSAIIEKVGCASAPTEIYIKE